MLTSNRHRKGLFRNLADCITDEIRPRFRDPLIVNGSFVTSVAEPNDVDVALDLRDSPPPTQDAGLRFKYFNRDRLASQYQVDFLISLPGSDDFSVFFQHVKAKTAQSLGLSPSHRKGILRIL